MKKHVLVSAAVLALGAGSMMLTGFDSAATVDEVVANYNEASKDLNSLSATADMDMGLNLGVDYEGSTLNLAVSLNGNMDISYTKDPLSMAMTGNFTVNAMGEDTALEMKSYIVPGDDGCWDTYAWQDDGTGGEWSYEQIPAEQAEELMNMITEAQLDPDQFPIEYTLAEEPTDVNGTACYHLSTSIAYDLIQPILEEALSASTEDLDDETMAVVEAMLSGIVFNMEMDVDAETYLPLAASMNMDGSDFSAFSDLIGSMMASTDDEGNPVVPETTLEIPTMEMNMTYDYSAPEEIVLPVEALEAKENPDPEVQDIEDVLDMAEEMESEAE